MTPELAEKSKSLFCAAGALEETWLEIGRLSESLNSELTKALVGDGKPFATLKPADEGANILDETHWSYQYDFKFFKRGRGRRRAALLSYECRLCWPENYKICRVDGSEIKIPLVVVRGTDDPEYEFSCYGILTSPTERNEEGFEYDICGHLLSQDDEEHWYRCFAVPLFAIGNEADLKRELVDPACQLIKSSLNEDTVELEKRIFANSSALRWKEGKQKQVFLDE